jgi:hypothetical protein
VLGEKVGMAGSVQVSHDRWPALGLFGHINGSHIHAEELGLRIAEQTAGCFVDGDESARSFRRRFMDVHGRAGMLKEQAVALRAVAQQIGAADSRLGGLCTSRRRPVSFRRHAKAPVTPSPSWSRERPATNTVNQVRGGQ